MTESLTFLIHVITVIDNRWFPERGTLFFRAYNTCTDSPEDPPHSPISAWELEALPQHQQQLHPKHSDNSYTDLWDKKLFKLTLLSSTTFKGALV